MPGCVPSDPEAGHCNDMIDNDCNGLIDCDDPTCAPALCQGGTQDGQDCSTDVGQSACTGGGGVCHCPSIRKDPTKIKFGKPGGLDVFTSHGRVVIEGTIDVGGSELGWLISNSRGSVFLAALPPGTLQADLSKTDFRYLNKAAKTTGGIRKAQIRVSRGRTSYGYRVEAYGDMSKATDAQMSIQFYIGSQSTPAIHKETWTRTKWGWKTHVFE